MNKGIYWSALKKLVKDFIGWIRHPSKKGVIVALQLVYFLFIILVIYLIKAVKKLFNGWKHD